jgi:hypothetical protein
MITTFPTYETAGIHAGLMRSEGHYSAVLDEHIGFMWGPLLSGGFRVVVSDQPVEDEGPLPPLDPRIENLLDGLRMAVTAYMLLGTLTAVGIAIRSPEMDLAVWIALAKCVGLLAVVFSCLAPLMVPAVRAMRDENSAFGRTVRILAGCVVATVFIHWVVSVITVLAKLIGAWM